jgi:hypothetical protein
VECNCGPDRCAARLLRGKASTSLQHLPWCHRQQDEDLDQLGESVTRIGHLGLTIHEELNQQVSEHCHASLLGSYLVCMYPNM